MTAPPRRGGGRPCQQGRPADKLLTLLPLPKVTAPEIDELRVLLDGDAYRLPCLAHLIEMGVVDERYRDERLVRAIAEHLRVVASRLDSLLEAIDPEATLRKAWLSDRIRNRPA